MIEKILSFPERLLRIILNTPFFVAIASNPFLAALTLSFIVLFWSFPSYDIAFVTNEMDECWKGIFLQSREPFVDHTHLYEDGSHNEKLGFRFVPPLIFQLLHINSLIPALIFQFATVILFYYLLILVMNKFFQDRIKAFFFTLPICFVVAGHVYASDYRGIFDTLALDFLLMAILVRTKSIVVIPLLLAYYTDERAIIASSALFLINVLDKNSFEKTGAILKELTSFSNSCLIISWILYGIIRYMLSVTFGLTSGTGGTNLFIHQIDKTFYTLYVGLEGFLIPFVLIIFLLLKKRIYTFTFLLVSSFLLVFYAAQSVVDIGRSMSYVLLILIIILILLDKLYSKETVYRIITWVIIISLLYDEYYPLLAQLYRMKFITHSI